MITHPDPLSTLRHATGPGQPTASAVTDSEWSIYPTYPDGYVPGPNPSVDALNESLKKQWCLEERGVESRRDNRLSYWTDNRAQTDAGPSNLPNAYHTGVAGSFGGFDPLTTTLPEPLSDDDAGTRWDTSGHVEDNPASAIHDIAGFETFSPPAAPYHPRLSDDRPPLILHRSLQPRSTERLWDPETRLVNFEFDLRHPHSGILLPSPEEIVIRIPLEMEEQPATTPPCSYLRIVHPALRWTIHVRAGTYLHPEDTPPGRGGKAQQRRLDYVSVIDVLREICMTLHKPLPRAEFELLHTTPEQRKHTTMAFYQRCRYMHLHPCFGNQEENGMRRVDVLGVRVSFIGLVPTSTYGKFRMILADRPRERAAFGARPVDLMMPLEGEPEAAGYNGPIPWGWKDPSTVWGLLEWYKIIMPSWEQELRGQRLPRRDYEVREESDSEEPVQGLGLELG